MTFAALLVATAGLALFALSIPRHWRQLRGNRPCSPGAVRGLRVAGACLLGVSLLLCLRVDHPTMAVLVWVMNLAVSAVAIALWLGWFGAAYRD